MPGVWYGPSRLAVSIGGGTCSRRPGRVPYMRGTTGIYQRLHAHEDETGGFVELEGKSPRSIFRCYSVSVVNVNEAGPGFLMSFRVPEHKRIRAGQFGSDSTYGKNGAFLLRIDGVRVQVVASDGLGWEHVSVSRKDKKLPNWNLMCKVKDIFWDDGDCVVQYHPPKEDYVNAHPGCLHLWRPTDEKMPRPDSYMVGPK